MEKIQINSRNLHALKKVQHLGFSSIEDFIKYMMIFERKRTAYIAEYLKLSPATIKKYRQRMKLPIPKSADLLGPRLRAYKYSDVCIRCGKEFVKKYNFKNLKRSERSAWCDQCRKVLFGVEK